MSKIKTLWEDACRHAAAHREAYHHCLHASHFSYLVMIVVHGPYTVAATWCMLTLLAGYVLRLEIPDAKTLNTDSHGAVVPHIKPPRLG